MDYKSAIRNIPDYPKEGILFRDITTLLKDNEYFPALIDEIAEVLREYKIDAVVGPEARGFLMGAPAAYALRCGFIPARKAGKLPCETECVEYDLEYGTAKLEIHKDAIKPGMRIAIVDDLLATGGTAKALCELTERMGGEVAALCFGIELSGLGGRELLSDYNVESIIRY